MALEETGIREVPRPPLERMQLTILAADVVGYARLTEAAEEDTYTRLRGLRVDIVDPCIVSYRGRIIKNTGDGFLAAFDSSVDAVRCAIELQGELASAERAQPPDRKLQFRMGLEIGQAIVEPEDIYGLGVNVAARLEECAPPGGIVISAALFKRVAARIDVSADDLGFLRLKNISRAVHAYSLLVPGIVRHLVPRRSRSTRKTKVPSVAVLPFRSHDGDRGDDDDYFGEGMVEDIVVALQSIRGLLVIARTSTLAYRGGLVDLRKVGQDLGVRYVLSGSVRRTDTQLRIVAELSDIEAGAVIWADRYDGELSDLFEFQSRIATRIVWSIAPHVREAELKRALRKRADNMNAYDLVLQAITLMYRMEFADFMRARALLEAAIAADESYATAYAYAAAWHIHNVAQGWSTDDFAESAEAARLAGLAAERDPADGFVLAICGHTQALLRDYDRAITIFDRSLATSPSNAMAWALSSGVYAYMEKGADAVSRAEQGLRLSPADTQAHFYLIFLGQAHYISKNYEEAIIWARKTATLNWRFCANLRILAASCAAVGQTDQARAATNALLEVQPRFRVSAYSDRCPYTPNLRARFADHLRDAGLPD